MQREKINTFLVNAFNTILQLEDRALSSSHEFSNLSVSEFHVIEAVIACGDSSSMSAISKRLGITVGSLTVAVKTLANKGFRYCRHSHARFHCCVPDTGPTILSLFYFTCFYTPEHARPVVLFSLQTQKTARFSGRFFYSSAFLKSSFRLPKSSVSG